MPKQRRQNGAENGLLCERERLPAKARMHQRMNSADIVGIHQPVGAMLP